ncbi:MAG: Ig-like domain-containing protein [Lachnospiraceae bacterium]|nr:Ig-like domain-containing protein [Lachnospiraceae bacterium]
MFNKTMKNAKRSLAMALAAVVVVANVPVMNADAATIKFMNNGKEVKTVEGDFTVSDNKLYVATSVSENELVELPTVSDNGCEKFQGWDLSNASVSGNETVSVNAIFETKHGETEVKITDATCTKDGKKETVCKDCGHVLETETIKAAHGETEVKTTDATCGKDGKKETICKDCKEVLKTEVIKATGKHTWDEGKVTTEATVAKAGVKTYTCKDCGATKTEEIAKVKATVKLNVKSIKLQTGKSTTAVVASGLQKGDKVVSWTSSNKKIVKVTNKGKITATKTAGKATITVKTKYGAKATVKVTTQKKAVALKKITVNKKKVTLKKGKKFQVVVTKSPITAQDKVTFKSSNKKVATVTSKGVIKAKKAGKATITVKAGKKTAKITVTVKKK